MATSNATSQQEETLPIHDLLGIGFGPANLALATALAERDSDQPSFSSLFLEQRQEFSWHPHMLLENTCLQISFLKDMATLRNPKSPFTFLNYLHQKDRLVEFINIGTATPDRIEYNDYLRWVAAQVSHLVRYERQVESVEPVIGEDGKVSLVEVRVKNRASGEVEVYRGRHLIVGTGGVPAIPDGVELLDGRIFHNAHFLDQIKKKFTDRDGDYRFVVVGSGQSAAEILRYLYQNYPNSDVTATIRRYAYKPADDSKFVNELFDPKTVDFLYALPPEVREKIITTHNDTNFSCVDLPLIEEIYRELYMRKVQGLTNVRLRRLMELRGVRMEGEKILAEYYNLQHSREEVLETDALILATGFYRHSQHPLLASFHPYLETNEMGGYDVSRTYRIVASDALAPHIYLQGFSQDTHGISESLLSILPVRAAEILENLDAVLNVKAQAPLAR